MTGEIFVKWTVRPMSPPRPLRHCGGCGASRAFYSSGRVRLNANGRRLDAWLIYKCGVCDKTWNRPLLDRAALRTIDPADLAAMERSDRQWVAKREYDLVGLRRFCSATEVSDDVIVERSGLAAFPPIGVVQLSLVCEYPISLRLDRFLSQALSLSRSKVQVLWRQNAVTFIPVMKGTLRKPVSNVEAVRFDLGRMCEKDRLAVVAALVE